MRNIKGARNNIKFAFSLFKNNKFDIVQQSLILKPKTRVFFARKTRVYARKTRATKASFGCAFSSERDKGYSHTPAHTQHTMHTMLD